MEDCFEELGAEGGIVLGEEGEEFVGLVLDHPRSYVIIIPQG